MINSRTNSQSQAGIVYTIRRSPRGIGYHARIGGVPRGSRLGSVLPCCPADTNFLTAVFSDSCTWCTSVDITAQQDLMANSNNAGNTSGVPCCDPNAGYFSNLFSNNCTVCNPIGDAVGLSQIPTWAWLAGGGTLALAVFMGGRR
ncbi:MAG: hypothetical protein M3N93_11140 [Acidobacteriota bacterium]|nr:hypothetical protein [Acidobacteriota bacterium]